MKHELELSVEQRQALAGVLDEIIPPSVDGRLPGAGQLGIGEALAQKPELAGVLAGGLAGLDSIARRRGAAGFLALPAGERRGVLDEVGVMAPAFLPALIGATFIAYYQEARVREALGLESRPPFPLGYAVEQTDFSLLDPVRRRSPFYREP